MKFLSFIVALVFAKASLCLVAKAHEEFEKGYGGYGSVTQGYYERPFYGYYEMHHLRGYKKRAAGPAEPYAAPTPEMDSGAPLRLPIAAPHLLEKRSAQGSDIVAEAYAAPDPGMASSGDTWVHAPAHQIGKRAASLMRLETYYSPICLANPWCFSPIRRPKAARLGAEPYAAPTPETAYPKEHVYGPIHQVEKRAAAPRYGYGGYGGLTPEVAPARGYYGHYLGRRKRDADAPAAYPYPEPYVAPYAAPAYP